MATIKLRWSVTELDNVLSLFDVQKVYRSTDGGANYNEITTPATRVPLVAGTTSYLYDDTGGDPSYYYAISYFNSTNSNEGAMSAPIQGSTVGPAPPVFESSVLAARAEDIRAFLRDQPEYNILLEDIEFEDEDIQRAMRLATAKYNAITPQTSILPENMNEWLLLSGVCCILFRSEGARQLRNQVQAQDGNIAPVGLDEKQALYAQWADRMCLEFETLATKIKIQNNMEGGDGTGGAYGDMGSGYAYLGRWLTGSRRNI